MSLISKTSILGEIILIILISFQTNSMRGRKEGGNLLKTIVHQSVSYDVQAI